LQNIVYSFKSLLKNKEVEFLNKNNLILNTKIDYMKNKISKQKMEIKDYIDFFLQNPENPFTFFSSHLQKEFGNTFIDSVLFEFKDSKLIYNNCFKHLINSNNFYLNLNYKNKNIFNEKNEFSITFTNKNTIYSLTQNNFINIILIFSIPINKNIYIFSVFFNYDILTKNKLLKKIDKYKKILKNKLEHMTIIKNHSDKIESLHKKVYLDSLTGIYRREKYEEYIITEFKDHPKKVALIMFDLDKFKSINDTYGHATGDIVIQKIGQLIKRNIRLSSDIAIRYGGEEFLAIIQSSISENIENIALNIAEKIRSDFEKYTFFSNEGIKFNGTVSSGIYHNINEKEDFSTFYQNADKALYFAKKNGRNQVIVWQHNIEKEQ